MEDMKLIVIEITEEEHQRLLQDPSQRFEIASRSQISSKIPISGNEIDYLAWDQAFSIAEPYKSNIFALFHFYEDGKEIMRVE